MQVFELGHVDPRQLLHGLNVVCPDAERRENGEVDVADILDYVRPGVPVYAIKHVTQGEHLNSPQFLLGNGCKVLLLCPIPTDFIKPLSYFASPPPPPLLPRRSFLVKYYLISKVSSNINIRLLIMSTILFLFLFDDRRQDKIRPSSFIFIMLYAAYGLLMNFRETNSFKVILSKSRFETSFPNLSPELEKLTLNVNSWLVSLKKILVQACTFILARHCLLCLFPFALENDEMLMVEVNKLYYKLG
jgi:hypothetical protein